MHSFTDTWDWINHVKQVLVEPQFAHFVVSCWILWNNRNGIVHGELPRDALELLGSAHAYLHRFHEARYHFDTPRPPEAAAAWSPPPVNVLKINVDASFNSAIGQAGVGVIVRNHLGATVAWKRRHFTSIFCPEVAETFADCSGLWV